MADANMPIAVVTGAASGLGASLVCRLLAEGWHVIGVDLRADAVTKAVGHPNLTAISADLSSDRARATLIGSLPQSIDLLMHCAGTSAVGPFETQALSALERVYATNLVAPITLTQALLAEQRLAAGASVVLVASLSCYVGYPGAAAYAASKDGLAAYGRSLAVALAAEGRHCLTVFPGPMRTPHARDFAPAGADEGARIAPDRVARAILAAVRKKKRRLVVGMVSCMAVWLGTLSPTLATKLIARGLWPKLRSIPPLAR